MSTLRVDGMDINIDDLKEFVSQKRGGSPPKPRHIQRNFAAKDLKLVNLYGQVNIVPGKTNQLKVEITGPASIVDRMSLEMDTVDSQTLIITGPSVTSNNNFSGDVISVGVNHGVIGGIGNNVNFGINHGSIGDSYFMTNKTIRRNGVELDAPVMNIGHFGGATVLSGDNIEINTDDADSLYIKIEVPHQQKIKADNFCGTMTIGDLTSDINLKIIGNTYVHIYSAHNLKLNASGMYNIAVDDIYNGEVKLCLAGAGKVNLRRGKIGKLKVQCAGTAQVHADVTTAIAKLQATGMSSIYVDEVTERLEPQRSGMSRIQVGKHPEV